MESFVPAIIGLLFCTTFGLSLAVVFLYVARKRERSKFQALIDSVPCSISWIASDETYVAANQQLASLLNIEPTDFIGKKLGFLGGKKEYLDFIKSFFHQNNEMQTFEFQVEKEDSTFSRDILSIAQKYNNGKEAVIIGVDITEQKEAQRIIVDQQQALIASEKLSSLGEMSSTIAKDIQTPLSEISAHSEHLKSLIHAENDKALTLATSIESTVQRISKVISGLITFSRDTSNDPFEKASVKDIISDTLELCRHRLLQKGISVQVGEIDKNLAIKCRKVQVQQSILNLLNNSQDAIEKLNEKWIRISVEESPEEISISISDSGKGIPKEIADRILQPFFSTKSPGKGTGLGLSIVQRVAESHGGSLKVDKDALNTCFQMKFPTKVP